MLHEVWTMRMCQFCLLVKELLASHYGKQYIDAKLAQGYDQELCLYRDPLDLSFHTYGIRDHAEKEMSFCIQIDCYTPDAFRGNLAAHFRREDRRRDDDKTRDWVMPSIFAVKHQIDYAGGNLEGIPIEQPGRLVDQKKIDWAFLRRYQWGSDQNLKLKKNNISQLEAPGFFDSPEGQPAQTIEDAIMTVRKLGYKYAWVDALCIVQDDVDNVTLNVDQMDQIYRGAHLTVIAAAGKDAYYGLPGVSTRPRAEGQLKATINGTLVSNSQVFFNCSKGCNFQEQYHFIPGLTATYTLTDPQASFDFENRDLWELYAIAVSEYTTRAMSNPLDKVRAFNGILKFLEGPFGAPFFFGLPTNLFEVALLWKPRGPCSRTALGFPSWSWAGWDAEVVYELTDSMSNVCECLISQATITIPKTNLELMSCTTLQPQIFLGWHRQFDDDSLAIHYTNTDPDFAHYQYPRPMRRVPETQFTQFASLRSPMLRVTAKTATFTLTEKHSHMRDVHTRLKTPCKEGCHELCYLAILDQEEHTAGTIIVGGDLLPQLVNRTHKFVAIARSTLSRMDDDPSWDAETERFKLWTEQNPESRSRKLEETIAVSAIPEPGSKFDWSRGDDEDDDEAFKRNFIPPNDDFFDNRYFSDKVYWPAVHVLLLSQEKDGVVERLGVGKIHVDAFEPIARLEEVLLG
ncbi:uncharacterized protein N0V89_008942 [Didymosphaeria variabile]|uniref:Heterokaryon incompatibility domain-containing protein n=1 Tax=Didymosphaeria variabile TaxID=1932322 RepID=A0A9W8XGP7_9PLEO|nr:uncharacterized protein N0V89_008942 [Didymosphaeria variabile]KAJ4350321.1 hypothetical protein N0V89_008942 [Didymosphaeria variabile]